MTSRAEILINLIRLFTNNSRLTIELIYPSRYSNIALILSTVLTVALKDKRDKMFRRLREKVQRSKAVYRKDSQAAQANKDALGGLPFEVWDIVFAHLSSHDRGSLALACHHLYSMVGPEVWEELKTNKRERYRFLLNSQDRHYPKHQLCWHCAKFHAGAVEARQRASTAPSNDWWYVPHSEGTVALAIRDTARVLQSQSSIANILRSAIPYEKQCPHIPVPSR